MKISYLILFVLLTSCSSYKNYKFKDDAYACIQNNDNEIGKVVTDVCLPIDSYSNDLQYYGVQPYEKIKMPDLDDATRYK